MKRRTFVASIAAFFALPLKLMGRQPQSAGHGSGSDCYGEITSITFHTVVPPKKITVEFILIEFPPCADEQGCVHMLEKTVLCDAVLDNETGRYVLRADTQRVLPEQPDDEPCCPTVEVVAFEDDSALTIDGDA